jgi:hypothetical protein
MKYPDRTVARIAALAALALALTGCDTIRSAAGLNKTPPDEFAVVTKAPLVVPPDYNLRPPKPGAVPTNQTSPTGAAQAALYSEDSGTADSVTGNYSQVEKTLLAQSGAANADHSIRQQIASDEKSMQGSDESFTDKVLFGGTTDTSDKPVDADAESQKAGDAKTATPPAAGTAAQPATDDSKKPDDSATIQKDKSGWLGGIF